MITAAVIYIKLESMYLNEFIDVLLDNGYGVVLHKVGECMKIEILKGGEPLLNEE